MTTIEERYAECPKCHNVCISLDQRKVHFRSEHKTKQRYYYWCSMCGFEFVEDVPLTSLRKDDIIKTTTQGDSK